MAIVYEPGPTIADREFLAVGARHQKILDFLQSYGIIQAVGIQGNGS